MKKKIYNKFIAFTLVEVLLVLVIIGIIAAITIPPLVSNFQKQITINQYKKIYSTLSTAIKRSEADNRFVDDWDFSYTAYQPETNVIWVNTYITPYLTIADACENGQGCWATQIKKPNGDEFTMYPETNSNFLKYRLPDGAVIAVILRDDERIEVLVDVNGSQKPNIMGKDVFDFWLLNKNSVSSTYTYVNPTTGGIYPCGYGVDITGGSYSSYGCGKNVAGGSAGSFCGMKIIEDGYRINDDYPW